MMKDNKKAVKVTDKQWLTPDDFEIEFGMSKETQKTRRARREIPYHKVGNFIYYKREDINKWLDEHKVA